MVLLHTVALCRYRPLNKQRTVIFPAKHYAFLSPDLAEPRNVITKKAPSDSFLLHSNPDD